MKLKTATRIVQRDGAPQTQRLQADICVVGAGISGISAAVEAARLGRKVVLVDGLPALGGQAVNSLIGTFCGLFSNGPDPYQFTHGIADDILRDLGAKDALNYRWGGDWTTVMYDEVALSRWVEDAVYREGVTVILGGVLRRAGRDGRRITELDIATRYGDVTIEAEGFVDATGDAALAWLAGLPCREPEDGPVYGTQMLVLEGINEDHHPPREAMTARLGEKGREYGMVRVDGFSFLFSGRGIALINMTHVETPLEPVAASARALEGKAQTDKVVDFLKAEYPAAFGDARVRAYGFPGIRQTRWIVGAHHLTVDEVRAGKKFDDAVARCAWAIELHDKPESIVWESFAHDHVHYVPLGCLTPPDADNLLAVGRCIDADVSALSSVRVMGPCIATGAAAAHALDLAGSGSVHQIDRAALRERIYDNVDRTD
ncbi:MAG: FAD-dependent oxidoreductase [Rhodospirillales bacterium]|nr:FAD-dependent oxidoreductase [Rhodospirillales bacterium]